MKIYKQFLIAFLFSCALLLNSSSLYSQQILEWEKCYGSSGWDTPYGLLYINNNGYLMVGSSYVNNGDVIGGHGDNDAWMIRTDENGVKLWQKCFGGSEEDLANDVIQTSDGGFLICGKTYSTNGDVIGNHIGGNADAWLIKTDSSGNILWSKCYGGTATEIGFSICQTNDNGFVIAGTATSGNGDVTGYNGSTDIWLFKIDSIGTLLWQHCLGGTGHEEASEVKATADGGFIISGTTNSMDGDVTNLLSGNDLWLIKTDSLGVKEWDKCFGGPSNDASYGVIQTDDEGFMIFGHATDPYGILWGYHSGFEMFLVKTDSAGTIVWQKCVGGSGYDLGYEIIQNNIGDIFLGGQSNSMDGDAIGNPFSSYGESWVVHLDNQGNLIGQHCFGGNYSESVTDFVVSNDSSITFLAETNSRIGVSGNNGSFDFWLVKLTDDYNTITGEVFFDGNSNGVRDSADLSYNFTPVVESQTGKIAFTDNQGAYKLIMVDSGNYQMTTPAPNYYAVNPMMHTASFSTLFETDSLNDFAQQPVGTINDLCISVTPLGDFRSGENASYIINYSNVGTTTLSPTIIFYPDNNLVYSNSTPVATSVSTDSLVWNFAPIAPYQTGSILVTFVVNAGLPIGALINSGAIIEPILNDANTQCNQSYWEVFIVGSYDPNDILVSRDTIFDTELTTPPHLYYTIRFQNTGNAAAFNVRVGNVISTDLDVSTFEVVSSSHTMDLNYSVTRYMEFIFENIMLPDSNSNEPESHGFVRYRIKPVSSLVVGDSILNAANIYFDFNSPVLTNIAITEIVLPVGENELGVSTGNGKLWMYPNPARDEYSLLIEGYKNKTVSIQLFNVYGQLINTLFEGTNSQDKWLFKGQLGALNSGVYFIRVKSADQNSLVRMVKM